jgi:hypothetical protein
MVDDRNSMEKTTETIIGFNKEAAECRTKSNKESKQVL